MASKEIMLKEINFFKIELVNKWKIKHWTAVRSSIGLIIPGAVTEMSIYKNGTDASS